MKKLKQWFARQQEGLFWGGLVGLCAYLIRDRIPFVQKLIVGNSWLGNTATFIFIGMSIGALIDSVISPSK